MRLENLNRHKLVLIIVLVLSILVKSIISYYFFQFDNDKINQAAAAKNLVEGHGLTYKEAGTADISQFQYTPLAGWPPGYPLFLAPIYMVLRDIELSAIILLIISNILFFIIYLRLLLYLRLPLFYILLLLLLPAVSFHEYIIWSTPSDLLSVTACIYACISALQITEGKNKIIKFSIANSLSSLLRYMYWPISFLLPAILMLVGYKRKNKSILNQGLAGFIIALITCTGIYLFEKIYIGDSLYLYPTQKGIFWDNLSRPYPFTVTSFLNQDFVAQQLDKLFNINYSTWVIIFFYAHLIILFFLIHYYFKNKLYYLKNLNSRNQFFTFFTSAIYGVIIIVLSFISLRNSRFFPPPNVLNWTYISDGRYYIFMLTTFPIIVFSHLNRYTVKNLVYKFFLFSLLTIIFLNILHGFYYTTKIVNPLEPGTKAYIIQKKVENYIADRIKTNAEKNIKTIIASNLSAYPQIAGFYDGIGLFKTEILNKGNIYSSSRAELLLITEESYLPYYSNFINNPKVRLQKKIDDYYSFSYTP